MCRLASWRLLIVCHSTYFTTPTFTFLVQGRLFYVPTGLIASLSSPLNCLITLDMKEKSQGYATLEDVTAATFDRFLEWATKGFYTPPLPSVESWQEDEGTFGEPPEEVYENGAAAESPTEAPVREEDAPEEPQTFDDLWGSPKPEVSEGYEEQATALFPRPNIREAFYSRVPSVRRTVICTSTPRRNIDSSERYTNVFLCHAQLYVFADAQDIQELKTLALEELHAVLAVFELHLERTGDIIELLRYVYANTARLWREEDPLRELLSDYVGFEMDILMEDGRFADLMAEGCGYMLQDFMSSVRKRIQA